MSTTGPHHGLMDAWPLLAEDDRLPPLLYLAPPPDTAAALFALLHRAGMPKPGIHGGTLTLDGPQADQWALEMTRPATLWMPDPLRPGQRTSLHEDLTLQSPPGWRTAALQTGCAVVFVGTPLTFTEGNAGPIGNQLGRIVQAARYAAAIPVALPG